MSVCATCITVCYEVCKATVTYQKQVEPQRKNLYHLSELLFVGKVLL